MDNLDFLLFIIPGIITFQIGVFVFLAGKHLYLNRVFLLLSLLIVLWEIEGVLHGLGIVQVPLVEIGGLLLPVTFFQFTLALCQRSNLVNRALIYFGYLWAISLLVFDLTPVNVLGELFTSGLSFGGMLFYLAYFSFYTAFAIYFLVSSYLASRKSPRSWRYPLVATAAIAAIASGALRGLPNPAYPVLLISGFFSLSYAFVMGWALWRYEVMHVSPALRSGSAYSIGFTLMLLVYLVLAQSLGALISTYLGWESLWHGLVAVLVLAPSFYPLRKFLDRRLGELFPTTQDLYQDRIARFSKELAHLIPIDELAVKIIRFINEVFMIEEVELVILNPQGTLKSWRLYSVDGRAEIKTGSLETRSVCSIPTKVITVPLNSRNQTVGWLKLGRSVKGSLSKDELEMLESFAGQSGTALQNAQLFSELSSLSQNYKAVVTGTLNGVVVVDNRLKIVTINKVAATMLGLSEERAIGEDLSRLQGTEGLCNIIETLEEVGRPLRAQKIRIGSEGKEISVLVNASFTQPTEDRPASTVLVLTDLTEHELVEEQMHRTERLASMGRLTAGLAHEIRNGLNKIGGYALILQDLAKDLPDLFHYAQGIQEDVQELADFLNRFLMFAKNRKYQLTRVTVHEIIHRGVEALRNQASKAGITIKEDYHGAPCVPGDAHQLEMAFFNLLINAVQALIGVGGGEVTIRVWKECKYCRIQIEDNGPGIPPEDLKVVFDPFYTTKETGTGLGLPITHKIIRDHKGEITLKSEVNKGTTFTIELPLCTADTPENSEEREQ